MPVGAPGGYGTSASAAAAASSAVGRTPSAVVVGELPAVARTPPRHRPRPPASDGPVCRRRIAIHTQRDSVIVMPTHSRNRGGGGHGLPHDCLAGGLCGSPHATEHMARIIDRLDADGGDGMPVAASALAGPDSLPVTALVTPASAALVVAAGAWQEESGWSARTGA